VEQRLPPLSPRLAALARAIPPGSRVADVGSDHGKLPLWLAATGRAAFCLATERSEALLARVARPPAGAAWAHGLAYRSGNGLAAIVPSDRIDTVVLAGLGGRLTRRILDRAGALGGLPPRLVLQPRSEIASVRRWLFDSGMAIVAEGLTEDRGRLHVTLTAERVEDAGLYRHETLSRDDLFEAGPCLVRSPTAQLVRFWRAQRERLRSVGRDASRAERILAAISRRAG
jgi:tRNA (adenine22-N1)-methyltransferase